MILFTSSFFIVDLFRESLNDVRDFLVKVYLINAIIICVEGLLNFPFFYTDEEMGFLTGRFKGFSMIGGSTLSFINFLVYRELNRGFNWFRKFLVFLVFFTANFYVGRFGLLAMVIYEFYGFIRKNIMVAALSLPLVYLLAKVVVSSLMIYNFRGLEIFESILLNGNLKTTSTLEWLNQVTVYFKQVEFRLIGNGNFGNRLGDVNVGVDSAFLLLYNGGGLIFLSLSLIFILRSKYVRKIRIYYFLFCLKELFLTSPVIAIFGYKEKT